jgi:hypothetical protein
MTHVPPPHPKATAAGIQRLRESSAFRDEVRTTEAQYMPASFVEEDSSVTIGYIPVQDLRDMLRLIEAEEAARSAGEESLRPPIGVDTCGCDLPDSMAADNASIAKALEDEEPAFLELPEGEFVAVPSTICVRTR